MEIALGIISLVYEMWDPAIIIQHSVLWGNTKIASGTTSVYETWSSAIYIQCSVLWGNKVHYQKLRLTGKFLLNFYVIELYLTEIASGTTS